MPDAIRRRVAFLFIMSLLTISGLAAQLGNLQFNQRAAWQQRAVGQRIRELSVPATRGAIFDRQMRPLATNRAELALLLQYPHYKDAALLQKLSTLLGVPLADLQRRVERRQREEQQWGSRAWEPLRAVDALSERQYARLLEFSDQLPGVVVDLQPQRDYPFGQTGAHLLGYVGPISPDEAAAAQERAYRADDVIGKSGLEAFYEAQLRGRDGVREVRIDYSSVARSAPAMRQEPQPGHSLVLTIDWDLQQAAEQALQRTMRWLREVENPGDRRAYPNARTGAVVVLDVQTGAVLAMASLPAFDPNLFVTGINARDWERLSGDPLQPLWSRAYQAAYQPGSTWKMVTGGGALANGVVTPADRVFSGARYEPTGQKDWVPGGHGWVDLVNALRLSSNIYFYEMGRRLGIERLVDSARAFGFGRATGIDLAGEEAGFVPDDAFRTERGWQLGDTTSAAIGQIVAATPLQLARYAAALANGGKVMQPYLVQSVRDASGQVVRETVPRQSGQLPVPPSGLAALVEGMKRVDRPGGTSDFAIWPLPGMATASKTGTSEYPPRDDFGLFVGFAPADQPRIAVAVAIEQAGHGASVSPVARSIYADYFGIELRPGDPARWQPPAPATPAPR